MGKSIEKIDGGCGLSSLSGVISRKVRNNMTESEKLIRNEAEAIKCLKSNKPTSGYVMLQESVDMAIQVLEKQVPRKVKNSGERIPFEWYCPTCGELLCDDGYKDTDIKYCDNCGQKLDWSDEE